MKLSCVTFIKNTVMLGIVLGKVVSSLRYSHTNHLKFTFTVNIVLALFLSRTELNLVIASIPNHVKKQVKKMKYLAKCMLPV